VLGFVIARLLFYHFEPFLQPFSFRLFSDRFSHFLPGPASDCDPPPYASHIATIIGICHHTNLICGDGILLTFCLGWTLIMSLLILPPNFHFSSSRDSRCEPLHLALQLVFSRELQQDIRRKDEHRVFPLVFSLQSHSWAGCVLIFSRKLLLHSSLPCIILCNRIIQSKPCNPKGYYNIP
jgi:hypothetical protein